MFSESLFLIYVVMNNIMFPISLLIGLCCFSVDMLTFKEWRDYVDIWFIPIYLILIVPLWPIIFLISLMDLPRC